MCAARVWVCRATKLSKKLTLVHEQIASSVRAYLRATKLSKKLALVHEQISSDRTYLTRVNARERNVRYGEHEDYELAPQRIHLLGDNGPMKKHIDIAKGHLVVAMVKGREARINFLSPVLQILVGVTAFLSSLVAADRLFHFYVALYWRFSKKRPEEAFEANSLPDLATCPEAFPKVVVQIPMFNEKEVCEQVIDSCCNLIWPRSRLYIQILDDSTCPITRSRVVKKVAEKVALGIHVEDRWRSNRQGYKAGAMMEAEKAIGDYEFTAIFDADFSPEAEFLLKTIPYLIDNPRAAFVQTRWVFANADESVLTRVQEISLNYHLKCEQYARFATGNFFNFNGTAGVWRLSAIKDAGGWNNRTTVEDMDLSLRAYIRGWKFIFLNDVTCVNEIPSTYAAFRHQQHRWSCGPMQLWRKAMDQVWESEIPLVQKIYLNCFFFGTRLFATHIVSFVFYCTLVPICVVAPEVTIPFWALVYVPILVTFSTVAFTPRSWLYAVPFVLFENAMSIVKFSAMVSGILGLSTAHSWVVTQKLGNWVQTDAATAKTGLAKYLGKAGAIPHSLSLPVISESLVKQGAADKAQPKKFKSSWFNRM
ncbi:unnamed protein product [Closterium sp. NIES-54]